MAVSRVTEVRDAQGQVVALPPGDILVGLSTDEKPTTDSVGYPLKRLSRFFESDTGQQYIWTGLVWRLEESVEVILLRQVYDALDEMRYLLKQIRNSTGKLAWDAIGEEVPAG